MNEALLQHIREQSERRQIHTELSDEDDFGRHEACVLKWFDSRKKAIVHLHIEELLVKAEFSDPHHTGHTGSSDYSAGPSAGSSNFPAGASNYPVY